MGYEVIGRERLPKLAETARYISERANLPMRTDQPFVGRSAFAHKGGIHVSAVMKHAATYEHVTPEAVGNRQRILLSDLSGRSNVKFKLEHYNMAEGLDDGQRQHLLEKIKELEHQGYDFEVAEGNFELLVLQERYPDKKFFSLVGFDVSTKAYGGDRSEAVASIIVNDQGRLRAATGTGKGPFDALHNALRKAVAGHYPRFDRVNLRDYKVRVLDGNKGTAAKVRVLVEWADEDRTWTTVGISHDVIQASAHAMLSAIRLELLRAAASGEQVEAPVPETNGENQLHEAYGWGV
jgi:2-isopropylmalate synthase